MPRTWLIYLSPISQTSCFKNKKDEMKMAKNLVAQVKIKSLNLDCQLVIR